MDLISQSTKKPRKNKGATNFDSVPEATLLVNHIEHRQRKGLGTTIFTIGLSGTGKSSQCQRIAELIIERREDAEMFIVDSLLDLLGSLRKTKLGDIIVVEEVSVLFPSRRAMSKDNVYIGKVMDTMRKKQIVLLTNAPIWKSIDNHMKAMGHILIQTQRIYKKQGVVFSKFHLIQTNPLSGKPYFHTFINKRGRDVNRLYTKMPNMTRWNEYEAQKDLFMDKIYKEMQLVSQQKQDKIDKDLGIVKKNSSMDNLEPQYKEVWYLKNVENMKQKDIAIKVGLGQPRISQIIKDIKEIQGTGKEIG